MLIQHGPQICHRIKVLFISLFPHLCDNTARASSASFADSVFTFWRMHLMVWPTNTEHNNIIANNQKQYLAQTTPFKERQKSIEFICYHSVKFYYGWVNYRVLWPILISFLNNACVFTLMQSMIIIPQAVVITLITKSFNPFRTFVSSCLVS